MTYLSNHFVFYGLSEPSIPSFSKELIWGGNPPSQSQFPGGTVLTYELYTHEK